MKKSNDLLKNSEVKLEQISSEPEKRRGYASRSAALIEELESLPKQKDREIQNDLKRNIEKSISGLFEKLNKLPKDECLKAVKRLISHSEEFKEALERPVPPLPEPASGYRLFPGARIADPYEWLEEHWGKWLKHFNKDLREDHLFLDDLGKLDPKLKNALYYKRNGLGNNRNLSVSDIVPTRSDRINQLLVHSDKEELQKALRLATTVHTRNYRSKDL